MLVITEGYTVYDKWEHISIEVASKAHSVKMPDGLMRICQALSEKDLDKVKEIQETFTKRDIGQIFPKYYRNVTYELSNITRKKINATPADNITLFFNSYLFPIVYGLHYLDFSEVQGIDSFTYGGVKYYLPTGADILGEHVPMVNATTVEFTEASDIEHGTKNKFSNANIIIAILCRPKGENYNQKKVLERAEKFKNLPVSIMWEVYFQLYSAHQHIRKLYPKMFGSNKPNMPVNKKDTFKWRDKVIEMGNTNYFNTPQLMGVKAVEQSNMYDFLEIINAKR